MMMMMMMMMMMTTTTTTTTTMMIYRCYSALDLYGRTGEYNPLLLLHFYDFGVFGKCLEWTVDCGRLTSDD